MPFRTWRVFQVWSLLCVLCGMLHPSHTYRDLSSLSSANESLNVVAQTQGRNWALAWSGWAWVTGNNPGGIDLERLNTSSLLVESSFQFHCFLAFVYKVKRSEAHHSCWPYREQPRAGPQAPVSGTLEGASCTQAAVSHRVLWPLGPPPVSGAVLFFSAQEQVTLKGERNKSPRLGAQD